jgi:hypothetical protein
MGQLAVPMMIGAAVGGGTKLLQGKGLGGILKGAALGGALGGVGGGVSGLMGEGLAAGAAGSAGSGLSQGASGLLGATGAAGTTASLAVPTIAEGALAANAMIPYSAPIGMANSFNPLTGAPIATQASSFSPAMFANAPMEGGMAALNSGVPAAGTFDTMFGGVKDFANQYGTIDNLQGAAQIANMYQPAPQTMPQSGNIKVGQAPTGDIYAALREMGYTMPKRREINFSLLG